MAAADIIFLRYLNRGDYLRRAAWLRHKAIAFRGLDQPDEAESGTAEFRCRFRPEPGELLTEMRHHRA